MAARAWVTCMGVLIAFAVAGVVPAEAASIRVGSGGLTVDNDQEECPGASGFAQKVEPRYWDVFRGETVHLQIEPAFSICTSGVNVGRRCVSSSLDCSTRVGRCQGLANKKCNSNSPVNAGLSCTTDADCNINGTCELSLECEDGPSTVFVQGNTPTPCTQDSDCFAPGETGCLESLGFCEFQDEIEAEVVGGTIDVCYHTPFDFCRFGRVAYCGDPFLVANENHPTGSQTFTESQLRAVDENLDPIEHCHRVTPPCTNEEGSFCCSLTQGAYGAPNSVATAACPGTPAECPSTPQASGAGCGFIPAACSQGCDVFAGDPNGTTAGIHGTRAVTLDNLSTLIAYLPSGGTAGCFRSCSHPQTPVCADTHYGTPAAIPDLNPQGSNSNGQGGGVLSGQAMATRLNSFLSSCPTPFGGSSTFTASGFGGFQIPSDGSLVCTRRSGPDKIVNSSDDVCEAFAYPACTAGQTIDNVLAAANAMLAHCSDDVLGCGATDLNVALSNANVQFDQCGEVVACPGGQAAGVFTCP